MRHDRAQHLESGLGGSGVRQRALYEAQLENAVETAMGVPFMPGNHVRLLRNGDEIFPAMLGAIENARLYIDFLTFVYWSGDIAIRFAETLAEKARQGIDVRILLDGIGAGPMDFGLVELMRGAGATVQFFRLPTTWRVWRTSHRTHRKVLVCDGEIGFTGGVGIADEWCGNARHSGEWRETHVELRGPALIGLQAAFTGNWVEERHEVSELRREIDRTPKGDVRVMSVRSTASVGWSDVATLLWTMIGNAEERVRITTAYLVPDPRTVALLCETARRGVKVEIVMPGPYTDQRVTQLAHGEDIRPLLDAGVVLHRYQPTMIHAKVVTVDGHLGLVGSPNINSRSLQKDDECCLVIRDDATVATLDRHFDEDVAVSEQDTIASWERRPWWRRAAELVARPLAPQI
jgi:cardiolipin synthase A/B